MGTLLFVQSASWLPASSLAAQPSRKTGLRVQGGGQAHAIGRPRAWSPPSMRGAGSERHPLARRERRLLLVTCDSGPLGRLCFGDLASNDGGVLADTDEQR